MLRLDRLHPLTEGFVLDVAEQLIPFARHALPATATPHEIANTAIKAALAALQEIYSTTKEADA